MRIVDRDGAGGVGLALAGPDFGPGGEVLAGLHGVAEGWPCSAWEGDAETGSGAADGGDGEARGGVGRITAECVFGEVCLAVAIRVGGAEGGCTGEGGIACYPPGETGGRERGGVAGQGAARERTIAEGAGGGVEHGAAGKGERAWHDEGLAGGVERAGDGERARQGGGDVGRPGSAGGDGGGAVGGGDEQTHGLGDDLCAVAALDDDGVNARRGGEGAGQDAGGGVDGEAGGGLAGGT